MIEKNNIELKTPRSADDAEAIMALEKENFSSPLNAPAVAYLVQDESCVAAYLDGELAGYAAFLKGPFSCEIMRIAVNKKFRRRGIGRAMLRALEEKAKGFGSESLQLEVRSKNTAALALYESVGFMRVGLRKGYYRDPADDAVLMELDLTGKCVYDARVN
ncbi:MAG: ribosomal protein S18-alanine N-acetyltransferase [Clostridia bacterium]|nr:ribosomal protein S18-alanine N-acetyltransferase [Clostridia bacterium]